MTKLSQKAKKRLQGMQEQIAKQFPRCRCHCEYEELTVTVPAEDLISVATTLRDDQAFSFALLIDLSGVDYLHYGQGEWETDRTSSTGYSRAVSALTASDPEKQHGGRYAVSYHLLSIQHNNRLRLKVYLDGDLPMVTSVATIWPCANWYEREAYDLYGILFDGHPDLRRLLTDYGFIGHPFRKDFPLSGEVEIRYDAAAARCVYEPVTIQPRVGVPKVIRHDHRYVGKTSGSEEHNG